MALRKRGLTFLICFRNGGVPRKGGGVPTLEETMICNKIERLQYNANLVVARAVRGSSMEKLYQEVKEDV